MSANRRLQAIRQAVVEAEDVEAVRKLALNLGLTGKLLPQDGNDSPALDSIGQVSKSVIPIPEAKPHPALPGWAHLPLGAAISTNVGGGTPSKRNSEYWNGDIPWASVKDIQAPKYLEGTQDSITEAGLANSSSNLIPPNRLLVVTRMGLGKLAINTIPLAINQDLRAIEPTEALDLDYAYLLFKGLKMEGKGSTVKGITISNLHRMPISLPPLAEQKRIVAKVNELMALCDRLEAQLRQREALTEQIQRTRVVRALAEGSGILISRLLDPELPVAPHTFLESIVSAIVSGQLSAADKNDPIDLDSLIEATREGEQSEGLRRRKPITRPTAADWPLQLPEGWQIACLEDLAIIVSGVTKGRKLDPKDTVSVPYLRVANVQRGSLDLAEMKSISVLRSDVDRYRLANGDVLMTEGGDWDKVGRAAIWTGAISECIHQNHVYRLRPSRPDLVSAEWIEVCVNSRIGRSYFARAAKQTTNLASINMTQLRGCPIPIPPPDEQARVLRLINRFRDAATALEHQMREAQALRHVILETLSSCDVSSGKVAIAI